MELPNAKSAHASSSAHPVRWRFLAIFVSIGLLTYLGYTVQLNLTTASFLYLLIVVAAALFCGFWQASMASVLAVVLLDYFFLPPLFSFSIADPGDWVALTAFVITALVISRLSARELRNAREAALHRMEMAQLYELSRNSLLLDLRLPPGPQLVVLIQRIFVVPAVALYDVNLGRQDSMGDWAPGEENLAKECYLRGVAEGNAEMHTAQRILRTGAGPVGALVVRGDLNGLVVDALAALSAIAIERHQSFEKEDRAENARKGEQLRAAVMDALAHEFKTPLTAVRTASSGLLELGGLTHSQSDLVELIDGEAGRMNALCTRLLQTAKLEAQEVGLERKEVNIKELLSEVLAARSGDPSSNSNRIHIAIEDPELTVQVDRGLLAMILTQYIDNARKYSLPDTPIVVAAHKSHTEVLISVHNIGSTIPLEDREQIFERFYRSPDQKNTAPGTGIGLSIVRKAAEAHHGHVWVISDDNEGTTFYLSLPTNVRRTH
jgi:two-component system sensor histidine kinase KdpD